MNNYDEINIFNQAILLNQHFIWKGVKDHCCKTLPVYSRYNNQYSLFLLCSNEERMPNKYYLQYHLLASRTHCHDAPSKRCNGAPHPLAGAEIQLELVDWDYIIIV